MENTARQLVTATLALLLLGAASACNKKSSGSSGGGARAANTTPPPPETVSYTSYLGSWRFLHTVTSGDGTCDTNVGEHEVGTLIVDDTGRFAVSSRGVAGRVDLATGQVTLTVSETEPCGRGAGTGQLTSFTEGAGEYAQTGTSPHSYSWRMVR